MVEYKGKTLDDSFGVDRMTSNGDSWGEGDLFGVDSFIRYVREMKQGDDFSLKISRGDDIYLEVLQSKLLEEGLIPNYEMVSNGRDLTLSLRRLKNGKETQPEE